MLGLEAWGLWGFRVLGICVLNRHQQTRHRCSHLYAFKPCRTSNLAQSVVAGSSSAEAVQSAALSLEGVHNVHGSYGVSSAEFDDLQSLKDDLLQEIFEDGAGLPVDSVANALDTTTASKAADSRLGDALDVVTQHDLPFQHLAVTLAATLFESFRLLLTPSLRKRYNLRFQRQNLLFQFWSF